MALSLAVEQGQIDLPGVPSVFFEAAIVLVMILLPTGLGGVLRKLTEPLTRPLYTRSQEGQ
ncbi:MAG: hypothetical protein ACTHNB_00565 [Gaiellaceae bacterium]